MNNYFGDMSKVSGVFWKRILGASYPLDRQ
jgi:hypothetical protein